MNHGLKFEKVKLSSDLRKDVATRNAWVDRDDFTITVVDHNPRGTFHFLVVPRFNTKIATVNDIIPSDLALLVQMKKVAQKLIQRFSDTPIISGNWIVGFHTIPSQDILHLHVISRPLKSSRDEISFSPPNFISIDDAIDSLRFSFT